MALENINFERLVRYLIDCGTIIAKVEGPASWCKLINEYPVHADEVNKVFEILVDNDVLKLASPGRYVINSDLYSERCQELMPHFLAIERV